MSEQKTVEVTCSRCHDLKWLPDPIIPLTRKGLPAGPPIPVTLPYVCVRCRAVLAGQNAVDPLSAAPSPAQQAARAAAAARLAAYRTSRAAIALGKEAPIPPGVPPDTVIRVLDLQEPEEPRQEPREPRPVCRCQRGCCAICNPREALSPDGALPENWPALRRTILNRDGRRCQHCGTRDRLTVHHITPRPDGTNDPRNLVTLCSTCHDASEQPAQAPPAAL